MCEGECHIVKAHVNFVIPHVHLSVTGGGEEGVIVCVVRWLEDRVVLRLDCWMVGYGGIGDKWEGGRG